MKTKNIIRAFIISFSLISVVLMAGAATATTYDISDNGSNSNNSVQVNQNNNNGVNQSNSANVNNNVNVNANTGGNSINGGVGDGSIKTGDVTTNVTINNKLNSNVADVKCKNCSTPTPTKKPSQPHPTDPPGSTNPPGNGGGNGGVGGASAPGQGAAPAILGLAATSGENELFNILKLLPALSSLVVGYSFLRKNA